MFSPLRRLATSPRLAAPALALGAAMAIAACAQRADEGDEGAASAIVKGSIDTERDAVVFLSMVGVDNRRSQCTGTIVRADVETQIGYVLTAGHCVDDARRVAVYEADDLSGPRVHQYRVLDFYAHPDYTGQAGSSFDIGLVRIRGVDESTPVLPMALPDELAPGTRIVSVGYGRTTPMGAVEPTQNLVRRFVGGTIRRLPQALIEAVYDDGGSICSGDSGGPVLALREGREYVVGVHSFVRGNCIGLGYSVRPSMMLAFLQPILDAPLAGVDAGAPDGGEGEEEADGGEGEAPLDGGAAPDDGGTNATPTAPRDAGTGSDATVDRRPRSPGSKDDDDVVGAPPEPTPSKGSAGPAATGGAEDYDADIGCSVGAPGASLSGAGALTAALALVGLGARRRRARRGDDTRTSG